MEGRLKMLESRAEGHRAMIWQFESGTAVVPLNTDEARIASSAVKRQMDLLESTGDFPEKEQYIRLYNNLITAEFISQEKK